MFRKAITRSGAVPTHVIMLGLGPETDQLKAARRLEMAGLPGDSVEILPGRVIEWRTAWPGDRRGISAMELFVRSVAGRDGSFTVESSDPGAGSVGGSGVEGR